VRETQAREATEKE
jgi:hypothetical protein